MSAIEYLNLPEPTGELQAHSNVLRDRIFTEIDANDGSIGFARYMEMALYEPGLGYYSAGLRKFGDEGDFVTAPEVSSLFSSCLANQCRQIISELANPVILEFGAGSGRMAGDLLTRLEHLHSLPDRYLIMETSADLRQRQKQLLKAQCPDFYPNITWLDRLPDVPLQAVIIANEVLDALPVSRILITHNNIHELRVGHTGDRFEYHSKELSQAMQRYCREFLPDPGGFGNEEYTSEIHDHYRPWLASISELLERGSILLIDYGYSGREFYTPGRSSGTLLCHYRHRVHDEPFWYPGLQDITASVNFSAVRDLALNSGLDLHGYTSQSNFLLALGLDELYAEFQTADVKDQIRLSREIRTLTLPEEMGERFRVMALGRGELQPLQGFALKDLSYQL